MVVVIFTLYIYHICLSLFCSGDGYGMFWVDPPVLGEGQGVQGGRRRVGGPEDGGGARPTPLNRVEVNLWVPQVGWGAYPTPLHLVQVSL